MTITPSSPPEQRNRALQQLLYRCTSAETRWNKKRSIPLVGGMFADFYTRSERKSEADSLIWTNCVVVVTIMFFC